MLDKSAGSLHKLHWLLVAYLHLACWPAPFLQASRVSPLSFKCLSIYLFFVTTHSHLNLSHNSSISLAAPILFHLPDTAVSHFQARGAPLVEPSKTTMLTELLGRLKRKERKKDPAAAVHSATWSSTASSNVSLVKSSKVLFHANPSGKLRPLANDANRVGDVDGLSPSNLSRTSSRVQSPGLTNLWERANETLQNDPDSEKRELAQTYAEILALELAGPEAGPMDTHPARLKQEPVAERLNARVEMLSHEQLSISIGSRELDIEPLLRNVSKHIVAARDLISSAAGADPHAALACAGGLVILTVSYGHPDIMKPNLN